MKDYLVRVLAKEDGVRGLACITTDLVNEARQRHDTAPTAGVALARALTGAALFGALLKVQQRVALKFEGTGPLRQIVVESDSYGHVRGYVAVPEADLPITNKAFDIVHAIGRAGLLTVVKDLRLKRLYEGVVPLADSTIDGDLTAYFIQSEQIPTTVEISELVTEDGRVVVAGGLLLQDIPTQGADDTIWQLQDRIQELPPIADMLYEGKTPEEVMALLFAGVAYEVLEQRPLQFRCNCSREQTSRALATLGRAEIENLLETDGEATVNCHFCHSEYLFSRTDLELLLEELS